MHLVVSNPHRRPTALADSNGSSNTSKTSSRTPSPTLNPSSTSSRCSRKLNQVVTRACAQLKAIAQVRPGRAVLEAQAIAELFDLTLQRQPAAMRLAPEEVPIREPRRSRRPGAGLLAGLVVAAFL